MARSCARVHMMAIAIEPLGLMDVATLVALVLVVLCELSVPSEARYGSIWWAAGKGVVWSPRSVNSPTATPTIDTSCDAPRAVKSANFRAIPLLLHRTHRYTADAIRGASTKHGVEGRVRRNIESCAEMNPAAVSRYYDDYGLESVMSERLLPSLQASKVPPATVMALSRAWRRLVVDPILSKVSVLKADLFRLAIVYLDGGWYLDADVRCIDPIAETLLGTAMHSEIQAAANRTAAVFATAASSPAGKAKGFDMAPPPMKMSEQVNVGCVLAWEGEISEKTVSPLNWAFGCAARHPFLLLALEQAAAAIMAWKPGDRPKGDPAFAAKVDMAGRMKPVLVDVLEMTGPQALQRAVEELALSWHMPAIATREIRQTIAREDTQNRTTWDRATLLPPWNVMSGGAWSMNEGHEETNSPGAVLILPYCFFRSRGCKHLVARFGDKVIFHHEFETVWRTTFFHNYYDATMPHLLKTDDNTATRTVSWWWSGMGTNASDPAVRGLLEFCQRHRSIVTTVMMRCGLLTCCHTGTGECGNKVGRRTGGCTNNGGTGGTVSGELSTGCKYAIPRLVQMGIRPEIWLGEDDSVQSARYLLAHANKTAASLIGVANANPGISGFNIDLETKAEITSADVRQLTSFLRDTTAALQQRANPLRFSADVGCNAAGEGGGPLGSRCKLQGASGVSKLMDMSTYFADDYSEWFGNLQSAVKTVPPGVLGVGLIADPWVDMRRNGNRSWTLTKDSALDRICAAMNLSVQEIAMYDLRTTGPEPYAPQAFWIEPLERFMTDSSCSAKVPTVRSCPNASKLGTGPDTAWRRAYDGWPWIPNGFTDCCESNGNRGPDWPVCSVSCARAECEATRNMEWVPQNYSRHPYLCCQRVATRA